MGARADFDSLIRRKFSALAGVLSPCIRVVVRHCQALSAELHKAHIVPYIRAQGIHICLTVLTLSLFVDDVMYVTLNCCVFQSRCDSVLLGVFLEKRF